MPLAPDKKTVTRMLREMAALLEIKGENPFRARAYESAAHALEGSSLEFGPLVAAGAHRSLPGVGPAIAEKLDVLATTGRLPAYEDLKASLPDTILELAQVPGLGPKKIHALHKTLGVASLDALEEAARAGRVAALPGFGEKSAAKILEGIAFLRSTASRRLLAEARAEARALVAALAAAAPFADGPVVAGSLRRFKETVKDLDLVGSATDPEAVMAAFVSLPGASRVVNRGPTKSTIVLPSGLSADLRLVSPDEYAFALLHFTGSAEHNVAMRALARERGLKLNEYGLWRGDERIPARTEAEIFAALGLAEIPPELREAMGEIDEAREGPFPRLVTTEDLRGVLHVHSTWSDGRQSIEDLALAARDGGYEYLGICDHSRSAGYAGGLSAERVRAQWAEIDSLNVRLAPFRIFKGIEADILQDGSLDYDDDLLEGFDFVVASVHSRMTMSEPDMTERICRAVAHPRTTVLGHPTGRRLLAREAYAVDMQRVIETAIARGVVVELNCNPERMDIDWRLLRSALPAGLLTSVNPDAHGADQFAYLEEGAGVARKGRAEPRHVLNAFGRDALLAFFAERRGRKA